MVTARLLLPILAALVLGVLLSGDAYAEEVFVLENGVVLRGRIVRENEERIVVRLSGFADENTVTVRRGDVLRRFTSVEPKGHRKAPTARAPEPVGRTVLPVPAVGPSGSAARPAPRVSTPEPVAPEAHRASGETTVFDELPAEDEPALESESFFSRVRRVSGIALPRTLEGLAVVTVLCFVVLTIMVAGGTRALGMKLPTLGASSSLGLLLGIFLLADFILHQDLLRADRAIWILPTQAIVWLTVARTALDAPLSRTVPLFAFVLFGATCFIFFTGSVLVSL